MAIFPLRDLDTGCVILDGAPVHIGDNVLLAPNVHIYTAAINSRQRAALVQWAEAVRIGDRVWIGGNATICPGITSAMTR